MTPRDQPSAGGYLREGAAMTPRELATVLAALRTRQWDLKNGESSDLDAIATNHGAFDALSLEEIDDLCERLNA